MNDKIFLEFPLCALSYVGNEKSKLDSIISWCIIALANSFSEGSHKKRVVDAADALGISGGNYSLRLQKFSEVQDYIDSRISQFGNDPYCRIGKKLIFETRDGQFDFNEFRVLCALSSIIGKKKLFVRITYERISYRMLGFKDKKTQSTFGFQQQPLTYKQLRRIVEILHSKKFYSKFTYANRQMYFSTRLEDDMIREKVKQSKIYWAKKKLHVEDTKLSNDIKAEISKIELEQRAQIETARVLRERDMKLIRLKRVI